VVGIPRRRPPIDSPLTFLQAAEAGLIWKVENGTGKSAGIGAVAVLFVYMGLFTTGFQAVSDY
jgi:hypothetical protein